VHEPETEADFQNRLNTKEQIKKQLKGPLEKPHFLVLAEYNA
jgi:hypothetical protein